MLSLQHNAYMCIYAFVVCTSMPYLTFWMQLVLVSWETHVVVLCRLPQPEQNKHHIAAGPLIIVWQRFLILTAASLDCNTGMLNSDAVVLAKTCRDAMQTLQVQSRFINGSSTKGNAHFGWWCTWGAIKVFSICVPLPIDNQGNFVLANELVVILIISGHQSTQQM